MHIEMKPISLQNCCVRECTRETAGKEEAQLAYGLIHCPENFLLYELNGDSGKYWNMFSCEHHQILNDHVPLNRKELDLPVGI